MTENIEAEIFYDHSINQLTSRKDYICPYCDDKYHEFRKLKKHVHDKHKATRCELCEMVVLDKSHYSDKIHMMNLIEMLMKPIPYKHAELVNTEIYRKAMETGNYRKLLKYVCYRCFGNY